MGWSADQLRSTYSIARKAAKWWKYLFWFMADVAHLQCVHPDEGISESHPYNEVSKAKGKEPARIPKKTCPPAHR